jgi:hypothetical protein
VDVGAHQHGAQAVYRKEWGIVLFWRNGVDDILQTMSKYFIHVVITSDEGSWQFSGLYGELNLDKKTSLGEYYKSLIVDRDHGYAWGTSMKLCSGMRSKVGWLGPNVAWTCLKKRLKIVIWRIWVTEGICSPDVIIITMWKATFGKDLIQS